VNPRTLILLLSFVAAGAGAGCASKAVLGTGTGGSGGAVSCEAVTNADGTVCKQCIDASGVVVDVICPPATGTGGTTGSGGAGAAGTTGTGGAPGGANSASCVKLDDGGPTSCKDTATWKMYGAAACAQQNLTLTDIAWGVACANTNDRFQTVTYLCCAGCVTTVDADGLTCTTCTDTSGAIVSSACGAGPPPK
jgi:hypothetical protein